MTGSLAGMTWKRLLGVWLVSAALFACGPSSIADVEGEPGEDEEFFTDDPEINSVSEGEAGTGEVDQALLNFQMPFPCGQSWVGSTYTGHSPSLAVDLNRDNDSGDTVVAAASGRVTRSENLGDRSYGQWIEIDHGSGWRTRYAHLSVRSVGVGATVSQGQKIGNVGNTGGSTGAHLHYEHRYNGNAVKIAWNGSYIGYYTKRSYTSRNKCSAGGGGGVTARVNTSGAPLSIRSGPGTGYPVVGSIGDGASVTIRCQKRGTSVTGTYGTSTLWDNIGSGYIADAYVYTGADGQVAPTCQ